MKRFHLMFLALLLSAGTMVMGQNSSNRFLVGLGTHAVDYWAAGHPTDFFRVSDYGSIQAPISRVVAAYSLSPSFAVDAAVSLGSVANTRIGITKQFFTNSGIGLRYKFANGHILKESSWFDPYLRVGVNYSYYDYSNGGHFGDNGNSATRHDGANAYNYDPMTNPKALGYSTGKNKATVAGGLGINFWLTEKVGLNIETAYNKGFGPHGYQDFFQHSAGIVFRFGGIDTDKDGTPDKDDLCPDVPGPRNLKGCPDTDGDGVLDKDDMCPTVAGPVENSGCPDTDGDGLHDGIDKCPTVAGPKENNGCPWPDQDGDGVPDKDDKCPTVAGTFEGCPDTDGDGVHDGIDQCPDVAGPASNNGCPVTDTDGDGIPDATDACPTVPGSDQFYGCPKPENIKDAALFDTNRDNVSTTYKHSLKPVAKGMNETPGQKYKVVGYADERGSVDYNRDLSVRRAESVKKVLRSKGYDVTNDLETIGEGKTTKYGEGKSNWSQNRRVQIFPPVVNK